MRCRGAPPHSLAIFLSSPLPSPRALSHTLALTHTLTHSRFSHTHTHSAGLHRSYRRMPRALRRRATTAGALHIPGRLVPRGLPRRYHGTYRPSLSLSLTHTSRASCPETLNRFTFPGASCPAACLEGACERESVRESERECVRVCKRECERVCARFTFPGAGCPAGCLEGNLRILVFPLLLLLLYYPQA